MGKLLLLASALAAPLVAALALQLEKREQPETPSKTVLLVVAGLTRHFSVTWPSIEQSILLPNEASGYKFKIIFSTETGLECVPSSPNWKSRKCEDTSDPSVHRQHIKEVFAPRQVKVLDHGHLCLAPGNREAATDSMMIEDVSMPAEVGAEVANATGAKIGADRSCAPWFERVHRVVEEVVQSGETFDRVVALRPDILIQRAVGARVASGGQEQKPPELVLDRMCERNPGISFVTPTWTITHRSWLHNRDLDFVHILCPGDKLPLYEEALRNVGDRCHFHPGYKTPRVPPGFKSTKGWNDYAFFCRFVQVFNESNIPMAHWDDEYTCDWPSMDSI